MLENIFRGEVGVNAYGIAGILLLLMALNINLFLAKKAGSREPLVRLGCLLLGGIGALIVFTVGKY